MIDEATITAIVVMAQRKTKCFIRKSYRDSIVPNASEKLLANRQTRSKRIKIINTNQSVPKKSKIVQTKTGGGPPEAGGSASEMKIKKTPLRGGSINRKPGRKKSATAAKGKVSMPPEAGQTTASLDEQIRIRAYFISERRRRFALPGDADSDWLEAKRQLLSESGPR